MSGLDAKCVTYVTYASLVYEVYGGYEFYSRKC
jgi:hypothetical protein